MELRSSEQNTNITTIIFTSEFPDFQTINPQSLMWIPFWDAIKEKLFILDENTGTIIEDMNGQYGGRYGGSEGFHDKHDSSKSSDGKYKGDPKSNGERKGSGGRY
jgi:hypothetical protein